MRQRDHGSADASGTAASHPAVFCQHNRHYTQKGLWIPVAGRMTGWGSRILTAARITADNEKALPLKRQPIEGVVGFCYT